ncbi:pentapeptide repeat-containing protein [Austwickia sp. TVS 96-490-7B]|uniref:pentapeptide repeat-containing protein n=1 Tax=Austwickia sp. TVS 96-490-7B TaxID=2830843 RepID=UPI001C559779|nr:pentapeptide repeat-containing protein [Austwickia sp. TVS 96-490-7B]
MPSPAPPQWDLQADCSQCTGLCCVALPYTRSADFPATKTADTACPHLDDSCGCRIHDRLTADGWHGCRAFHCAGAGPHTAQVLFPQRSWRTDDEPAVQFDTFRMMLGMFEIARYVEEARARVAPGAPCADPDLAAALAQVSADLHHEVHRAPPVDRDDALQYRARAAPLLHQVAAAVRDAHACRAALSPLARRLTRQAPGADLAGRNLRGADLRGSDLTGALLIGTDLRGADLAEATLLGVDPRGALLDGTKLDSALFAPPGWG